MQAYSINHNSNNENIKLPKVFGGPDRLTYDDRLAMYQETLLDCKPSKVTEYLRVFVDLWVGIGWTAIWKSSVHCTGVQEHFDVVVQVYERSSSEFKARIILAEPFQCDNPKVTSDQLRNSLEATDHQVALVELHPVFSEEKEQQEIAVCIEHLRFFYKFIWRGWDEDDDEDYSYCQDVLKPRLKLYYDIRDGKVEAEIVDKFFTSLEEYKHKHRALVLRQEELRVDDPDVELDGAEVEELNKLNQDLEILKSVLQMIENPSLRCLVTDTPSLSDGLSQAPVARGPRLYDEVVVHIVINKLTAGLTKTFDDDTILEHHTNLDAALQSCHQGDTVLLYPGIYHSNLISNIAESISIKGMGKVDDVIIESIGDRQEFLIHNHANKLVLMNLKLKQVGGQDNTLCVERGHVIVDGCEIECDASGVQAREEATLEIIDSVIYGAQGAGVVLFPRSTGVLKNVHIHHCGGRKYDWWPENVLEGGVLVQVKTGSGLHDIEQCPSLLMQDCTVESVEGYCLTVEKEGVDESMRGQDRPLKGLQVTMENCVMDKDKEVGVTFYTEPVECDQEKAVF